ncbi:hypothetical protein [Sulfuricaulis sp.]|jgi:hypothetical protein|uniref:hypothetical protein n=1 Tax=Sulfuricaulis sp. TaxID=2003553 RepID=UPI003559B0EF
MPGTGVFCVAKQPPNAAQKVISRQTAHKFFLPEKENRPRFHGKWFLALRRAMNPILMFCKIAPRGTPWATRTTIRRRYMSTVAAFMPCSPFMTNSADLHESTVSQAIEMKRLILGS